MKNYKTLFLSIILLVSSVGIISADENKHVPPPQSLFIAPSIDQIWNPYARSWNSPKKAFQVNTVHEIESEMDLKSSGQKPIQNIFSGDHGFMTLEEGAFELGGMPMEWSIRGTEDQTAYFYADDYGLRVRGHFRPGYKNDIEHPCQTGPKDSHTSYLSPFHPVNLSGQHITGPGTDLNYETGISLAYDNGKIELGLTGDQRTVMLFGTQKSDCYTGPMFVTEDDGIIVALDFKNVFTDKYKPGINFIQFEYWVYYDPAHFQNLAQDIDHQIANSPIYCDPRYAHTHGSGHWSGSAGQMASKQITAGYANECLGISFEFFPPENANSTNIFNVRPSGPGDENVFMSIGLGSDDWIELEFEPLKCGNEMRDSTRIIGNNRRYLEDNESESYLIDFKYNPITTYPYRLASANSGATGGPNEYEMLWRVGNMISNSGNTTDNGKPINYCFLRDYIHNEKGSDPWQRLIDPDMDGEFSSLYDNEFVPYGTDISPMSITWETSQLAVMGRNGRKTANTSMGCDGPDAGCTFSSLQVNLSNEFGNKIRGEINNTLRHIIYVDGTEASFPIENAARKAWFYTNTHKVRIKFRMDAQPGVNLSLKERENKWDAILNTMMVIPVQPESEFMNEKLSFKSSYRNGEYLGIPTNQQNGFFYNNKDYEWVTTLKNKINEENAPVVKVLENIIEAPIIDKPLDIASKATSLFSGNKEEKIDTSLFDASEQAVRDRERQLQELEEQRRKLDQESANRQDDLEFQREMQRLELESMRAELELERERMELEMERQNLEDQENMRVNNKEYFSEDDRGFFSKPKAGTEKTGGGFQDITSDPTKLAMLGLAVTLGTTLLQMFRGN